MKSKPIRKNPHKERIFTQKQNIQDFAYLKDHHHVRAEKQSGFSGENQSTIIKNKGGVNMATAINRVKKMVKGKARGKAAQTKADPSIYAERVEKKAYELYEKRGCENGHDWDDWFEAEKLVEVEMIEGK